MVLNVGVRVEDHKPRGIICNVRIHTRLPAPLHGPTLARSPGGSHRTVGVSYGVQGRTFTDRVLFVVVYLLSVRIAIGFQGRTFTRFDLGFLVAPSYGHLRHVNHAHPPCCCHTRCHGPLECRCQDVFANSLHAAS